jgi:hypothetical protein
MERKQMIAFQLRCAAVAASVMLAILLIELAYYVWILYPQEDIIVVRKCVVEGQHMLWTSRGRYGTTYMPSLRVDCGGRSPMKLLSDLNGQWARMSDPTSWFAAHPVGSEVEGYFRAGENETVGGTTYTGASYWMFALFAFMGIVVGLLVTSCSFMWTEEMTKGQNPELARLLDRT